MPAQTTIRALSVDTLDIPLFKPFGISGGAQDIARNLLVTVELADGTRGYGEAAPFPAYNGETQASARAAIECARASVEGADAREWRRLAAAVQLAIGPAGSAQCAIETAVVIAEREGSATSATDPTSSAAAVSTRTTAISGADSCASAIRSNWKCPSPRSSRQA